ncbi:MAG TPA: hypothetical protein VJH92_05705 [Candidatus Nanoarchaeia archaeon]|nr:hypothetical protein [Candidatus Nanoarchaeia archaeon]
MKRKVVIALVLMLIFLQGINALTPMESLDRGVNEAVFHGAQYHSGNENYAEYLSNINQVEEELNSELIIVDEKELDKDKIARIIGEPNFNSPWVLSSSGQVQVDRSLPLWIGKIIFDGKQQLKIDLIPFLNNEKVSYRAGFSNEFVQSKPLLNLQQELENIVTLAKTFDLDPSLENANSLAESSVNMENLFRDYMSLIPAESCEDIISSILGKESKISEMEIVTEEYEMESKEDIKVLAKIEICEKCIGTDRFVNLDIRIEKNGKIVSYPKEEFSLTPFEGLDSNGFKRAIIDEKIILSKLLESGNYKAANDVMNEIEDIYYLWQDKYNSLPENERVNSFVERNQFLQSLFEELESKSSSSSQILYEKNLIHEIKENKEEICSNKIDDNGDQNIDCEDSLCSGKVCGTEIIRTINGNESTEEEKPKYCVLNTCKLLEEENKSETPDPVCGNNICENGENSSCSSDCNICPSFPPLECSGEVISSGEDINGCSLEPICLEEEGSCSKNEDCIQPLCGNAECLEEKCTTTSLEVCQDKVCVEGETKSESCQSGENAIVEICSKGAWTTTGLKCDITSADSTQEVKNIAKACVTANDCSYQGEVCMNGFCKSLAIKKELQKNNLDSTKPVNAITISGEVIKLTATGITGIVPDPDTGNPNVLGEPTDYNRPSSDGSHSSFLTGGIRNEGTEEEIIPPASSETEETVTTNTISLNPITENEENVFSVEGLCIKQEKDLFSALKFEAHGERYSIINQLRGRYQEEGSEPYCKWKIENLLRVRKELENSLTNEFIEDYFEKSLPNFADNWENAHKPILDLYSQIIDNQIETAEMMECLGIKQLSDYKLIEIDYKNPLYGSITITEKLSSAKFNEMKNEVTVITPTIEGFTIIPSKAFIENELTKSMENKQFPGSYSGASERAENGGLTSSEKIAAVRNNNIRDLVRRIVEDTQDKNFDIQLRIIDSNGETLYNLYVRINEDNILKAAPISKETNPNKNAELVIPFDEFYEVVKDSRKRAYNQNSPWETRSLNPATIVTSTIDWISTQLKINNLMNSISVYPENHAQDLKSLGKEIMFVIAQESVEKTNVNEGNQQTTVWNRDGKTSEI